MIKQVESKIIMPEEIHQIYATAACLYSKQEVEAAFDKIAVLITEQLANSNPIMLCVVVGGIVTLGNLLPRLNFPLEVDYIHATRYRQNIQGHGLEFKAEPTSDLRDRNIIIVDDVLDGGVTLQGLVDFCYQQGAAMVYTAVLVDKKNARLAEGLQHADFYGLIVENYYIFGYGLDYKGYLRNAPGIYRVTSQVK